MTQNINFPIVLRVIGWLLMIEGAYMLLPLLVSLWFHEYDTVIVFALSVAITLLAGVLMTFGIRPEDKSMRKREGLIL
ncbi:MAG: TrkH family potassium uptake protein, partial [Muribaculaceae bacterium]|nr:TrkH family potassium uptake protein [Muribaculaceae bacterium]